MQASALHSCRHTSVCVCVRVRVRVRVRLCDVICTHESMWVRGCAWVRARGPVLRARQSLSWQLQGQGRAASMRASAHANGAIGVR